MAICLFRTHQQWRQSVKHWFLVGSATATILHQYLHKLPYTCASRRYMPLQVPQPTVIVSPFSYFRYLICSSTQPSTASLHWKQERAKAEPKNCRNVYFLPEFHILYCWRPSRNLPTSIFEWNSPIELGQSLHQFMPFTAHKDQTQVPFKFNNNRLSQCKQIQWKR